VDDELAAEDDVHGPALVAFLEEDVTGIEGDLAAPFDEHAEGLFGQEAQEVGPPEKLKFVGEVQGGARSFRT